jgi:cytochrome c
MLKKILATLVCIIPLAAQAGDDVEVQNNYFGYKPPSTEAAAGLQIFKRCKECHSLNPALNTFGPNLRGIFMRPAASLARFDYSEALQKSGIIWDEKNLRDWISGNTWLVHGNRMRHIQITDPAERDYLIAFLKSFK